MHQIGSVLGLAATLIFLGAQAISAQDASAQVKPATRAPQAPPNAAPPPNRFERVEPGPSARPARPGTPMINDTLTEEQRTKVRESNDKLREEQQPLYTKMRDVRKELADLEKADSIDETKIREKAKELGSVEGELAVLRAKHFQQMKTILPKDQVDRLREGPGGRFAPGAAGPVVNPVPGAIRPGVPGQQPPSAPPSAPVRKSATPNP